MKYVLMFVDTEDYAQEIEAMSPPDLEQVYQRVNQWFADHADKITATTGKLQGAAGATTVRLDGDKAITTDGPFMEGKEVISGFTEIEVADLDEALRMVRARPACPVIEIRPVEP